MSQPDDETRLRDMLDYAGKAVEAVRGRSRLDLDREVALVAGLERFVELIGEAAEQRRCSASLCPGIAFGR